MNILTKSEKINILKEKINEYNDILIMLENKNEFENSLEKVNSYTIRLIAIEIQKNTIKRNSLLSELDSMQ